jgi:hypothetical protein
MTDSSLISYEAVCYQGIRVVICLLILGDQDKIWLLWSLYFEYMQILYQVRVSWDSLFELNG